MFQPEKKADVPIQNALSIAPEGLIRAGNGRPAMHIANIKSDAWMENDCLNGR